jgi:formylglycine-generating enzyme required for sulfatase activity
MKMAVKGLGIAVLAAMLVFTLAGCNEPEEASPSPPPVVSASVVNISAIQGVTVPAKGETPVTIITENAQYSGTVTWIGNPSVFAASTEYTAVITLTAKSGFTLQGVSADFFTVAGAKSVNNAANSGVVFVVFSATASTNIASVSIYITAPVKGETPSTTAETSGSAESGINFSIGAVSWLPPGTNSFLGNTVYTALVTLTANNGYAFTESISAAVNGQNAAVSNNTGSAVTLSHAFPATGTKTVTNIAVKTQPSKLTAYTHGDKLDLTGLTVTLTYDDATTEDIAVANFADRNITTIPVNGGDLIYLTHNGQPVEIKYGSLTCETNNLTVNRATPTAADFNISGTGTFTYNGNTMAVTITPKTGKSNGTITVKYNDDTIAPSATGTYNVTFDVSEAGDFNAANGLTAGTLTINKATPRAGDFDISGLTQDYDGSPKTVIITPKEGKSDGTITVKYNGSTTAPSAAGTYTVTFDVSEAGDFNAANGLSAGTMTITATVTFNSVTANGSASQSSTQLTLNFSQTITNLSERDITLSGVSGVTKGYLDRSGATYYLSIYGFTAGGTLTVSVAKSGFNIIGTPKTVTIYYYYYSGVSPGTIEMASIPAGTFIMGSPENEPNRNIKETQHSVTLSSFKMSKYQVTQAQWIAVMGAGEDRTSTSYGKGDNYPIYIVSWYDAIVFCNKLSIKEGLDPVYSINGSTDPADWGTMPTEFTYNDAKWDGVVMDKSKNGYRLPTEAEWEYACRGDYPNKATETNTKPFGIGDGTKMVSGLANFSVRYPYDLARGGSYEDTSATGYVGKTKEVGSYAANNYGLYDMHGNVLEWCWDWYGSYSSGSQTDPTGAVTGSNRVERGGSWGIYGQNLRSACRYFHIPGYRNNFIGFRLVRF